MKKDLNSASIVNELSGQSAYFKKPVEDAPQANVVVYHDAEQETVRNSERKYERPENRTENRTLSLPTRRPSRRYSFELFDDQIVKLKQLKHDAEMRGERVNISDIARTALDEYLRDR